MSVVVVTMRVAELTRQSVQGKKRRGLRMKPLEAPKLEEQKEHSKALGETWGWSEREKPEETKERWE